MNRRIQHFFHTDILYAQLHVKIKYSLAAKATLHALVMGGGQSVIQG